ncbi:M20 family metallopeptidase [Streptomyces sp. NPDC091416]|uniref:M20 family metallopeptidase n=1 Tax=Streptomyces sp. NPDC091416 TaxID=3366003 RepID=UPI003822A45F
MRNNLMARAADQVDSVVGLARELIRRPSRGGIDDYAPVLAVLESWLMGRSLPHRRLHDEQGQLVGLLVEISGGRPGPWWALDACVDTAPFGDESAWSFPPTIGDVADHWLRGRGAADSKLAASMFCYIAADLHRNAGRLKGGLAVLLDVDEHTGGFGGARAYLADPGAERPAGVMIGYPGLDEVVVGGRGLWRAVIKVHSLTGHSGSSRTVVSAISRAARLFQALDEADLPPAPGEGAGFPLPAKLSVTAIRGGEGFSVTADRCELNVDVRTTPGFDARGRRNAGPQGRRQARRRASRARVHRGDAGGVLACLPAAARRAARCRVDGCGELDGAGGAGEGCRSFEHWQPAGRGRWRDPGHCRFWGALRGPARH